jgi:hypothetical protein
MIDTKTPAADAVTSANTPRLKKDGTPDRRGGKIGNRGNRHATGRKKLPDSEPRTNLLLYTSDTEFLVMKDFCRLLKDDPATAKKVLADLGTPPPAGKKPPQRTRKSHGIRLTAAEKEIAKKMLLLVKDRITACKLALENATKQD